MFRGIHGGQNHGKLHEYTVPMEVAMELSWLIMGAHEYTVPIENMGPSHFGASQFGPGYSHSGPMAASVVVSEARSLLQRNHGVPRGTPNGNPMGNPWAAQGHPWVPMSPMGPRGSQGPSGRREHGKWKVKGPFQGAAGFKTCRLIYYKKVRL